MKALAVLFIGTIYLISILGVQVNIHHCGSDRSYSFYGIRFGTSCVCNHESGSHNRQDCCSDYKVIVKEIKQDKTFPKNRPVPDVHYYPVSVPFFCIATGIWELVMYNATTGYCPPCSLPPPFYILYQNIRI